MKCDDKKCENKFHKYTQKGGYVDNKWFCNVCINNQPDSSKREDTCKHKWGSEEYENSMQSHYLCSECDAVLGTRQ